MNIQISEQQAALLDALIRAVAEANGEPVEAVRRGVEISVITRGIRALAEETRMRTRAPLGFVPSGDDMGEYVEQEAP